MGIEPHAAARLRCVGELRPDLAPLLHTLLPPAVNPPATSHHFAAESQDFLGMPTFAQPQLALASFATPTFGERERTEASQPLTAVGAAVGSLGADVVGALCSSLEAHHSALSLLLAAADRGAVLIPPGLRECLERAASTLPPALDRAPAAALMTAVA